jgi:hypothetical protein
LMTAIHELREAKLSLKTVNSYWKGGMNG